MKVFLDANVIIDFLDTTRARHLVACKLFETLSLRHTKIIMSEDILTNIFYINKNKHAVLQFLKSIEQRWDIVYFGKQVIKNAVDLSLENNLDLEDVLQCLCAKENQCDALISNDVNFYDCDLNIQTAETFLACTT
ncbi:putative protein [uncultured Candidatus Thioglobus sp.]|nr:putative protein [uncultured Candidatus Thioglobus sp.]SMN01191.1 putative protein [uncultured Candidatus Thioglobus sp.]